MRDMELIVILAAIWGSVVLCAVLRGLINAQI